MRLEYRISFDFEDHKGWEAYLGEHAEGLIAWHSETHPMVLGQEFGPGWSYQGYIPHNELSGEGFADFEETKRAFEAALLGECRRRGDS